MQPAQHSCEAFLPARYVRTEVKGGNSAKEMQESRNTNWWALGKGAIGQSVGEGWGIIFKKKKGEPIPKSSQETKKPIGTRTGGGEKSYE